MIIVVLVKLLNFQIYSCKWHLAVWTQACVSSYMGHSKPTPKPKN